MTDLASGDLASGKGHRDENFPVASWLVRADARGPVMAFYRFARGADDVADHPGVEAGEKLRRLGAMRAGLEGGEAGEGEAAARDLAAVCRGRGITLAHAYDLLDAFEQDCRVSRYQDWDGLMAYCRLSAAPVGRFVLDVHGEDRQLWAMSDALCAALQIINHLQDCGKDYRAMDRVYIPLPMLDDAGVAVEDLGASRASLGLRGVVADLVGRCEGLLRASAPFANAIADARLGMEVAVIHALAVDLCAVLRAGDPLAGGVHHGRGRAVGLALRAAMRQGLRRVLRMGR
jgi:squalene synthase HpnC